MTILRVGNSTPFGLAVQGTRRPLVIKASPAELAAATTLQGLIDIGVERGLTLWPEWGPAFTHLDKRIENRPSAPPKGLVGKRVAFHNGAHIGGRPGEVAYHEGLAALRATASSAGWALGMLRDQAGNNWHEWRKGHQMVRFDPTWDPRRGSLPAVPDAVGIVRSAITFTAVIAGFEPPTDAPKYPWQHASDPEDSEDWSYGWHVTDVVVLRQPIPCVGLQGPWTLAGAIEREAKRKAAR